MAEPSCDGRTVRGFIVAAVFWEVVGIVAGRRISVRRGLPSWNIPPWFTFGGLRVVHTNALAAAPSSWSSIPCRYAVPPGEGVRAVGGLSSLVVLSIALGAAARLFFLWAASTTTPKP